MYRISVRPLCAMMVVCASLMFCRIAHLQSVTLKWPKEPASQPSPQASPQGKSRNSQQSALIDRRPVTGSIVGRTYTNEFFDFSIEFPENWIVLWVNQGPRENPKAVVYMLLFVGSRNKQMHGTRWISIVAVRPLASSLNSTSAQNALANEANIFNLVTSMGLGKDIRTVGKPSEVLLGGRRLTRLHLAAEVRIRGGNYDTRSSQLALTERGYLLLFISSDPVNRESDAASAVKALESLHFFGEGHASQR